MEGPDSGDMRGNYGEHAPALERFAVLLTGDRAHAVNVVQEALRRARQDPRVADSEGRSARAWLFNAARDIVQRPAPGAEWHVGAGPDEINATVDRLLLGDALARLASDDRAVIRGTYYQGGTTAQVAASLHIPESTVKSKLHDTLRSLLPQLREMGIGLS